ncbi:transposase [Paenibacillus tengchongensis]|uniref:transposase n=1 Tax=Paenibacillus tengchongensis TaxID=2608684 RepID=UPI00124E4645|nr:transposase [Paenibacillus tengchongensis]
MGEQRQRYNEEFKRQTVKFIQEQTKTLGELAEELGIPKSTLHQWMGQYRELKNEPAASIDRVRDLEAEIKDACIDSWHSILKKELIYCNPKFKTREQAYNATFQYIEFYYNRKRMHSALGYLSPARFAEQFNRKVAA